jgi:hypothetical protein
MNCTNCLGAPQAARRSYLRWGTAIAFALVMIGSGTAAAFLAAGFTAAPAPLPSGGLPVALVSPVQSGQQLQQDQYLQNPGTPVSSIPNATLEGPLSPSAIVSFTVGFQMQNAQELANIINAQQTTTSGAFHNWLTLSQEE